MNARVDFIDVGVIVGAYGIRGWVKIKPYAARHLSGNALLAARQWRLVGSHSNKRDSEARQVTVLNTKLHHDALIAQFAEYHEREAAQALKGYQISIRRADFPQLSTDEYYWTDLIGLQVINTEGVVLGTIHHLVDNGAHAILCVVAHIPSTTDVPKTRSSLIPFVDPYILEVDLVHRQVVADWHSDWDKDTSA